MAHLVSIDYCGIFVTDTQSDKEIVMADSAHYVGTNSQLTLNDIGGKLRIELAGTFQERPITTPVPQARLDLYLNEKNRGALLGWIRTTFSPSLIARQSLPSAP